METLKLRYAIKDGDFSNAGNASSQIKKHLKMLSIDSAIIKKMAVSIYEAEVNMIAHARGGTIEVFIDEEKIKAVIEDVGPGIPDIDEAMAMGFSTASDEVRQMGFGAGMGLPNIKKNTDEMYLKSVVGKGTSLTLVIIYKSSEDE